MVVQFKRVHFLNVTFEHFEYLVKDVLDVFIGRKGCGGQWIEIGWDENLQLFLSIEFSVNNTNR